MQVLRAFVVAFPRQVRCPGVLVATCASLSVLAALAFVVDLAPAHALAGQVPAGEDVLAIRWAGSLDDMLFSSGAALGWGTALATLASVVLFAIADAALVLVSAGRTRSSRDAIAQALRRGPRLLAASMCGVCWLAAAALASRYGLRPGAAVFSSATGSSELGSAIAAELVSLALLAPGLLAADLARARIALEDRQGVLAPFAEALALVFTRVRPWLALALLALFEAALILGAAAGRPGWDAPEVLAWGPLALPLVLLVGRVLVHAAYLGALATSGAGTRPDLESPAAHAPSESTPRLRRHAGR